MTKSRYAKPTIIRHAVGVLNKYGRPPATIPASRIDGLKVDELVGKFGSPLFVLSAARLREQYRVMHRAFSTRYPRFQIAYSYKTNYLKAVCSILHQEGAWAEVVSGFEYDIARDLGVPGKQIVFNGPHKGRAELIRAFREGAMVNLDNYDELQHVEEVAVELGKTLDVGVRVNMDLNTPPWYKFGFHYESGQAWEAIRRAESGGRLRVVGLHIHIGTYVDDVTLYGRAAAGLVVLRKAMKEELGRTLSYWDLGGGFASRNTLHTAYYPAEQTCPSFDQYAEAICGPLLSGPFSAREVPRLLVEPGRALVDEPFFLVATVVAQKRLPTGQRAIVLDAGGNLLSSSQWYRYQFQMADGTGAMAEDTVIYGGLCMNIDVLRASAPVPPVRRGDILVIPSVGAYNLSQSWQFIYLRPAVVAIEGGEAWVVKEAESREYVQALEKIPEPFRKTPNPQR